MASYLFESMLQRLVDLAFQGDHIGHPLRQLVEVLLGAHVSSSRPSLEMLVAHHPVVFSVSVRRIDWGAKAAVLAFKVLLRDPTGTATESSNSNPDFASNEEVHQLLQGRNADPVDLCGDAIFD
jgi:hypothetical protein